MGPYPWPKGGAEAGRTWRAVADVLDGHVSRDASRLDADIAAFRAAVDRYHRKPHRDFPTGHGVIGFFLTSHKASGVKKYPGYKCSYLSL